MPSIRFSRIFLPVWRISGKLDTSILMKDTHRFRAESTRPGRAPKIPSTIWFTMVPPFSSKSGSLLPMASITDWTMFPSVPRISAAAWSRLPRRLLMVSLPSWIQSVDRIAVPREVTIFKAASAR